MTGFQEFHFGFPEAFLGFFGLPFLAALFWAAEKHRAAALNVFISPRLQSRLAATVSQARRRWSLICLIAALSLALVALAQPRWGFVWEERTSRGRDVLIAIDTSRSMLAQDLKPSRMARARLAAQDLLAALDGDRVGLIAFAGTAFLQAPLTADYDAVRNALSEIDAEIIPRGGTNLTAAIENADDAFGKGESEHRALIIFTDGEELEADALEAAKQAREKFRIFTVGLGSPEGGLIPLQNERGGTDFVRDERGQYVTSRLDEERLREIAESAGGFYVHLEGGPAEMQQIVREGLGKMKERDSDSRFTKLPIERYQWPLAGAVFFAMAALLIGERRRGLRKASAPAATAAVLLLAVLPLQAAPEVDFNRGCDAFKAGDYSTAAQAFSTALGTGDASLQSKAAYNLANTLARRGTQLEKKEEKIAEWKNAIQHYDRALALQGDFADAKHNRDLVQAAIAELEKEQKQEKQDKQEKKDDEQKDQKDQQQQSGEQKDEKEGEKDEKEGKEQPQKNGQSGEEKKEQAEKEGGDSQEGQKQDQAKNGQEKDGKSAQGEKKDGENKEQPAPDPAQNQPPKEGELKANNPQPAGAAGEPGKNDATEEAAAAAEGRMTEKQAKALLETIKDARARLLDPRETERRPTRGFKNW